MGSGQGFLDQKHAAGGCDDKINDPKNLKSKDEVLASQTGQ